MNFKLTSTKQTFEYEVDAIELPVTGAFNNKTITVEFRTLQVIVDGVGNVEVRGFGEQVYKNGSRTQGHIYMPDRTPEVEELIADALSRMDDYTIQTVDIDLTI